MAQQTVNIGSSANKGDGDPLRTAFTKINENFAEIYADVATLETATGTDSGGTLVVNAIQGSVIGEDSTLIVDATTSTVDAGRLTGTLPALDGSALTGVTVSTLAYSSLTGTPTTIAGYGITDAFDAEFSSLANTPTTLSGYGITDAYTQTQVDTAITNATSSIVIPSGSSQSIDVIADDSTLLVDSVNGTLNATTLTGALPAIDGSALTSVTTAFSNITSTPTTLAGYGITDAFDGAFGSLSGTPTTLAGYGITDAANTGSATTFTANVLFDTGVQEKFATLTGSTGVTAMDCDNGQVFYLTGAAGDITANFTNLGLTAEYGTNVTVIINQGATPYEVTAVQIGGSGQTIEWQGGSAPTGNANGIDSFSFTILNDGGSYVVLGQMVDFT